MVLSRNNALVMSKEVALSMAQAVHSKEPARNLPKVQCEASGTQWEGTVSEPTLPCRIRGIIYSP